MSDTDVNSLHGDDPDVDASGPGDDYIDAGDSDDDTGKKDDKKAAKAAEKPADAELTPEEAERVQAAKEREARLAAVKAEAEAAKEKRKAELEAQMEADYERQKKLNLMSPSERKAFEAKEKEDAEEKKKADAAAAQRAIIEREAATLRERANDAENELSALLSSAAEVDELAKSGIKDKIAELRRQSLHITADSSDSSGSDSDSSSNGEPDYSHMSPEMRKLAEEARAAARADAGMPLWFSESLRVGDSSGKVAGDVARRAGKKRRKSNGGEKSRRKSLKDLSPEEAAAKKERRASRKAAKAPKGAPAGADASFGGGDDAVGDSDHAKLSASARKAGRRVTLADTSSRDPDTLVRQGSVMEDMEGASSTKPSPKSRRASRPAPGDDLSRAASNTLSDANSGSKKRKESVSPNVAAQREKAGDLSHLLDDVARRVPDAAAEKEAAIQRRASVVAVEKEMAKFQQHADVRHLVVVGGDGRVLHEFDDLLKKSPSTKR